MPRFFFHVHDGHDLRDEEGAEFPTITDAKRYATKYAAELLSDMPEAFWDGDEWRMDVTDAQGLILFYLLFVGFDAPVLGPVGRP